MWVLKLLLLLAALYVGLLAAMYALQTQMLFPAQLAAQGRPLLPADAVPLEVETPEGARLRGVRLPPTRSPKGAPLVLLGFGGNAWNAESLALYLREHAPEAEIVAFHYRGYRPSGGEPSAVALLSDAPRVYDHVAERLGAERVVGVGLSIGAGVAAHLARERPLHGLILVTPFDSLAALASEHYPWAPARWLLRHRMAPAEALRGSTTPTAIIAAERDAIISPARTEALRRAIPPLVFDRTIADAGHNDLYERPAFSAAMVEALARFK